ncbi:MAG: polyprenyl synthetase family protein [Porticoccaceae bacterium]
MTGTLSDFLSACRARLEPRLAATLVTDRALSAVPDASPPPLIAAMEHSLLGGGKRLRPCLAYAAAAAAGEPSAATDRVAVAVELLHTYSLIHDDLPAMDDDDLRRGRPACHRVFGEAMAILAGDALQALAFAQLGAIDSLPAHTTLCLIRRLAHAAGAQGMVLGQAMDLQATGKKLDRGALETMHHRKTGDLIAASVVMGAMSTGTEDAALLAALDDYGHQLGLAFQVRDDLLDAEESTATLGKHSGADRRLGKATFLTLLGPEAARAALHELYASSLAAIAHLDARAAPLRQLADYAVSRRD